MSKKILNHSAKILFVFFSVCVYADDLYINYKVPVPQMLAACTISPYGLNGRCREGSWGILCPSNPAVFFTNHKYVNYGFQDQMQWVFINNGHCVRANNPSDIFNAPLSLPFTKGIIGYLNNQLIFQKRNFPSSGNSFLYNNNVYHLKGCRIFETPATNQIKCCFDTDDNSCWKP